MLEKIVPNLVKALWHKIEIKLAWNWHEADKKRTLRAELYRFYGVFDIVSTDLRPILSQQTFTRLQSPAKKCNLSVQNKGGGVSTAFWTV